jgi:hypothetical protein
MMGTIQAHGPGEIQQYKAGNQTVGTVGRQVAGTVGQLLIPFQVCFLLSGRHEDSPFRAHCIIPSGSVRLPLYFFVKAFYNKAIGRTAFTECSWIVLLF